MRHEAPIIDDPISLLEHKRRSTTSEFSAHVRSLGDVFYSKRGEYWVITRHAIAREALKNPLLSCDRSSFFISRMPNMDLGLIPDFFAVVMKMMVMSDGTEHAARRGLVTKTFTDAIIKQYGAVAEKVVHKLLSELPGDAVFDFVGSIAKRLPSIVLADLFSIDESDRESFYRWSINMTQFFGGASQYRNADGIEVNHSAKSIVTYLQQLVSKRKDRKGQDFLSLLLEENRFSKREETDFIAQAVMMLVAGQVTTTDQMNNNLYCFLERPGVLADLTQHPELLASAIEEANRWDPGVTFLFRVASEDTSIGEVFIPRGGVVFISNHAVNRDPDQFKNPTEFNIRRSPNPHMAYGFGSHYCLGAPLARLQMLTLFGQLFAKYPNLHFGAERAIVRDHYSLAFSGFKELSLSGGLPHSLDSRDIQSEISFFG